MRQSIYADRMEAYGVMTPPHPALLLLLFNADAALCFALSPCFDIRLRMFMSRD